MGDDGSDPPAVDVSDQEPADLVGRVRSLRRREMLAKAVGVALALVLGLGLFGLSYLVLPQTSSGSYSSYRSDRGRTTLRMGLGALGLFAGALAYRRLSPKEHVDDLE